MFGTSDININIRRENDKHTHKVLFVLNSFTVTRHSQKKERENIQMHSCSEHVWWKTNFHVHGHTRKLHSSLHIHTVKLGDSLTFVEFTYIIV